MSAIHIMWAEKYQPLTNFVCPHRGKVGYNPREQLRCHECRDLRWAKYLKIRVEYDYVEILCADGCYGERVQKLGRDALHKETKG